MNDKSNIMYMENVKNINRFGYVDVLFWFHQPVLS